MPYLLSKDCRFDDKSAKISNSARGCADNLQQKCLQVTGLKGTSFPLKYLGVPITASRLIKIECASVVEKIMAKVQLWTTRKISFAGRARLINNVIFGRYIY